MQKYWCNYKTDTVFFYQHDKRGMLLMTTTLQHKMLLKFRTVKAKKLRIDKLTEWPCIR